MPILFDGNLLGTILLLHDQEDFYTIYDARYLSTFTQYIAMPLYGLLERDNYRTPPKIIRTQNLHPKPLSPCKSKPKGVQAT